MERVSPNFQVIALGLPVPIFYGHTLDPPLRSRFQSKNITFLPYETMLKITQLIAPNLLPKRIESLLALAYAFISQNQKFFKLKNEKQLQSPLEKTTELDSMPLFPIENIIKAIRIWV